VATLIHYMEEYLGVSVLMSNLLNICGAINAGSLAAIDDITFSVVRNAFSNICDEWWREKLGSDRQNEIKQPIFNFGTIF